MYEHGPMISWPHYYYSGTSPSFGRNCAIMLRAISIGMISRHLSPTSAPARPTYQRYHVSFELSNQRPGGGVKRGIWVGAPGHRLSQTVVRNGVRFYNRGGRFCCISCSNRSKILQPSFMWGDFIRLPAFRLW